ncbi:MAG: toxin [Candidatus Omnitrophica bacterium]|nr:toxin [Candidatus Omnitrophota bacterium]
MNNKDIDKSEKSNTIVYTIRWNPVKSARLKRIRGISFEEIIHAKLLDICDHPGRDDQQILIFDYKSYIWAVPFIIDSEGILLKTLYPSRRFKKIYKKRR